MSDKPREFWIEFSGNPAHDKTRAPRYVSGEKPGWIDPSDEAIHVIEYSAYEEERKRSIARKHEIHRLRSELSRLK